MTAAEAKEEFSKLAKKHGIAQTAIDAYLQALDNEAFAAEHTNGYVRHPEYASALDQKRNAETARQQAEERLVAYEKWYREQGEPTWTRAQQLQAEYDAYVAKYGEPSKALNGNSNANAPQGLTREEVKKLLEAQANSLTSAVVEYDRLLSDIREEHRDRFGKRLPLAELEKFMKDNQITDLSVAYDRWSKPQVEAVEKSRREEERKKDREEWEKEFRSRHKFAAEPEQESESLLAHLNREHRKKDYDEATAQDEAREAFSSGYREHAPQSGA